MPVLAWTGADLRFLEVLTPDRARAILVLSPLQPTLQPTGVSEGILYINLPSFSEATGELARLCVHEGMIVLKRRIMGG